MTRLAANKRHFSFFRRRSVIGGLSMGCMYRSEWSCIVTVWAIIGHAVIARRRHDECTQCTKTDELLKSTKRDERLVKLHFNLSPTFYD